MPVGGSMAVTRVLAPVSFGTFLLIQGFHSTVALCSPSLTNNLSNTPMYEGFDLINNNNK